MLQLKKFPDIPVSTREEARESRPHPEEPRLRLLAREEGSFPAWSGKNTQCSFASQEEALSTGMVRGTPGSCHHSHSPPDVSVHSRETCFPCTDATFSRGSTHTTVARGTALWESLVGKPRGKASRESHRFLNPREWKRDTAGTAREESARACPHSRGGLSSLGRLQKYPKIHVSNSEESSASGTFYTQGLRTQHQRERNPERPPSNSHGDWPFLGHQSASLRSPS